MVQKRCYLRDKVMEKLYKIFTCFWAMLQWLDQHTQYLPVQLFIGGDSYSGIIVPLVTKKVLEGKTLSWQLESMWTWISTLKSRPNLSQANWAWYMDLQVLQLMSSHRWTSKYIELLYFSASVCFCIMVLTFFFEITQGYLIGSPRTDSVIDENSKIIFAHRMALISDELYEVYNFLPQPVPHYLQSPILSKAILSSIKYGRNFVVVYTFPATQNKLQRELCERWSIQYRMCHGSCILWKGVMDCSLRFFHSISSSPRAIETEWFMKLQCIKDLFRNDILEPKCAFASPKLSSELDRRSLEEDPADFILSPPRIPEYWCRVNIPISNSRNSPNTQIKWDMHLYV